MRASAAESVQIGYKAVHYPFQPAPRHAKRYEGKPIDYPETMANTEENYRSQSNWIKERRYGIHGIDHMETGAFDKDPVPSFDKLYHDFCETVHGLDENIGRVLDRLDKLGLTDDTLVIFSSDNGPEVPTVINMRKTHKHDGARPWRGVKRDNWEGGHRVPFIARWPRKVRPGTVTNQTICLTDLMATFAEILDVELPNEVAEDSLNFLPVLLGKDQGKPVREYILHQTISLSMAIRRGNWKYLDHKGSGGSNYGRDGEWGLKQYALPDKAPDAPGQLYNLQTDPGETDNLYFGQPEIVKELKAKLEEFKKSGRSVPPRSVH